MCKRKECEHLIYAPDSCLIWVKPWYTLNKSFMQVYYGYVRFFSLLVFRLADYIFKTSLFVFYGKCKLQIPQCISDASCLYVCPAELLHIFVWFCNITHLKV